MINAGDLLTAKELAGALRRHTSYVYAMKKRGFRMPGGLATLAKALQHLDKHPNPRGRTPTTKPPTWTKMPWHRTN